MICSENSLFYAYSICIHLLNRLEWILSGDVTICWLNQWSGRLRFPCLGRFLNLTPSQQLKMIPIPISPTHNNSFKPFLNTANLQSQQRSSVKLIKCPGGQPLLPMKTTKQEETQEMRNPAEPIRAGMEEWHFWSLSWLFLLFFSTSAQLFNVFPEGRTGLLDNLYLCSMAAASLFTVRSIFWTIGLSREEPSTIAIPVCWI